MLSRILIIVISLFFIVSCKTFAQDKSTEKFQNLIETFNSLTSDNGNYELEFIREKNTLYIKYEIQEKLKFGFKAIVDDIHPEGVFVIKKENTQLLRILSLNNGKVFVREQFRGQYAISNNTNIIDIELPKNISDRQINELLERFKFIFFDKKEGHLVPIQTITLPKTKN